MQVDTRLHTRAGLVITLGLICIAGVVADDAATQPVEKIGEAEKKEQRDAALESAKTRLAKCELRLVKDPKKIVERVEQPVLLFGDAARANKNGTFWVFGRTGRPAAFLELYRGLEQNAAWCYAVTLTGTDRVVMKTPLGQTWQPGKTQIEPALIPNAPEPAEKEETRMRQAKELLRRFAAHEFWDPDNSRFELRPLVRPIHRYRDLAAGIQDGMAFVFANGTNPEVLVLLEAIGPKLATARWHYSLARVGSAEFHVELDGKDVWKQNRAVGIVGTSNDPYWLFFSPATPNE